jgi:alpha-tubulin suppressor-like RCC1 family protein
MFVLTEKGDVFVYKIKEHYPEKVELFGPRGAGQIKGELMVDDAPLKIKDIG